MTAAMTNLKSTLAPPVLTTREDPFFASLGAGQTANTATENPLPQSSETSTRNINSQGSDGWETDSSEELAKNADTEIAPKTASVIHNLQEGGANEAATALKKNTTSADRRYPELNYGNSGIARPEMINNELSNSCAIASYEEPPPYQLLRRPGPYDRFHRLYRQPTLIPGK